MAKTYDLDIRGKIKWHRPDVVNQWGKYATVIYPIPEDLEKLRDLQAEGLKNVIKKDEDGYYVSFTRPASKTYGNQVKGFAPPMVFEKDGKTPLKAQVGNGSAGVITLEVYSHRVPNGPQGATAKAARWKSSTIHDLIVYNPDTDNGAQENEARSSNDVSQDFF